MRDNATPAKRGSFKTVALAVPVAIALGAALIPGITHAQDPVEQPAPVAEQPAQGQERRVEHPVIEGLPAGVSVDRVEWLGDRRIAIFFNSAAMPGEPIQVQMLLARDWFSQPDRTFPTVIALDGLRALDSESGWTINTNIEHFFADKNVNVVMPIGGQSSFYSDWQQPNNGKHYKWESFLTNEMIPTLNEGFRANNDRAIFGLSMGGTAAVNLAERRPDLFKFVGSFSGYLDTTSPGMPGAITAAQADAGGFDSTAMWGPEGSQDWKDHDPKLGVDKLKGLVVYVSAGSGRDDFGDPESVAKGEATYAGVGLEVISRMTTQTFVDVAAREGVEVHSFFRPSGVHDWPYWQYEMIQSWPYIAAALGVNEKDSGANCTPVGEIAKVTDGSKLGACLNDEYDINGGKAEDFVEGRAYWHPDTGAHALYGMINARYTEMGGPNGWLGFPTSEEQPLKNGGRVVNFQRGAIYWTPETGAQPVTNDIIKKWGELQWENGDLGYPVDAPAGKAEGLVQGFQRGFVVRTKDNQNFWVRGAIAQKYGELGTADSPLGMPVGDEEQFNGGALQRFEHGNIYWHPDTGAHYILFGPVFDAWGAKDYEKGEFGWPVSDHEGIPEGGDKIAFQHGEIVNVNGEIQENKRSAE